MKVGIPLLMLAAGCAGGRNFQRPGEDALVLGKTTLTEAAEVLGPPFQESTMVKNGQSFRVHTYVYVRQGGWGDAHVSGIMPGRVLTLLFLDDLLRGSEFSSSFEADHTDFDVGAVAKIEKGKTRRAELLALLGRPCGRQIPPLVLDGGEGLVWGYTHGTNLWRYQKQLVAVLNRDDVVSDVTFTETGKR